MKEATRTDEIDEQNDKKSYYSDLKFSEKSLRLFCNGDEWKEIELRRRLYRLKDEPAWKSGRWYHAFHWLSKECREQVLRFEGEHVKELFDVSGSDINMLAKHLEKEDIPAIELMRFQRDVMRDFRKDFGTRRRDGKCTAKVKQAFKVYLNSSKAFYYAIRGDSICKKIDEWFKLRYPTIREYIASHDRIWEDVMLNEFEVVSKKMFRELQKRGIKALTCHDAIYVKESVQVPDIEEMFSRCLGLSAYWQDRLEAI